MTSIGTIIKDIIIPCRKGNIRLNPEFVVLDEAHIQGFLLGTDYQRIYGIDIYNSKIREGQFRTTLTSKQKLSLLKILRKNRPAFSIVEEPLGKIKGHDIELYLDVERPYPPMLRRPPYPESLETRKEIDRVLSKCTPINRKISLKKCNFSQQELLALGNKVSGVSLAIDQNKVAAVLYKPVPKNIEEMQSLLGFASCYRNHIKTFAHITSSLYRLCQKDVVFKITKERRDAYERIKHGLTNAPVLILPDFELRFKLYIDAECSQGLGAALHQRQIVDGEPREGVICYISRQLKDSEARYGATKTECLVTMLSARPQQRELLPKRLLNRLKDRLILASCRSHSTM
ncbi:hypothetical protein O181_011193 [Austropuccinia psidii MF-1]|uniref:Reverse transcriptase/retrotransposon-derived protein RNase H-like domain-containing protein n=1 Tax=Austropuccinia psidii MF-1 TaxID=1389203 RepID=A0A9Q3BUT5_9BASI|nr:hypothetical protein [Austropuccinia psidii MF-1]